MLTELFKKIKKLAKPKWQRGGFEMPAQVGWGRRRWVREELNSIRYQSFGSQFIDSVGTSTAETSSMIKTDERKELKPIEVFKELTAEKPNLDLSNLESKIKAIKKRIDFMKDDLGAAAIEEQNVLSWLEARKKGVKAKIMSQFDWPVTTTEKLSDLLKKYKLTETTFNEYSLAVPQEAIDEMEKYVNLCRKVTKDEPEFILVIEDTPVQKTKHRDPIVLATSPFGKFLHVLGAWDKEVEIMHELYFKGK